MSDLEKMQELLRTKAEFQARLNLIPYNDGSIEIKVVSDKKYLYIRKRILGKVRSTYVGVYSEDLYSLLLRHVKDAKELKKSIKAVEKELAALGYCDDDLSPEVMKNVDFARVNMKSIIYDQAVLEGVATTFPDTEQIIENGKVNDVTAEDVQKILNLKHAWEFVLDKDVINSPSNYYVCQYVAKLVNEGFYQEGGRLRGVPVMIGGSSYVPSLPIEADVKDRIGEIVASANEPIDVAISLVLYVMKAQIFNDGNKRTAIIFANHYLIGKSAGLLVVPEKNVSEFKKLLVEYYESDNAEPISVFLKKKCWRKV